MIILHVQRLAIMTPPKCGTNTLHWVLCRPPFHGITLVGPTPIIPPGMSAAFDRHVNFWPSEQFSFRKVAVVRHPLERLVSMYLHLTTRSGGRGEGSPDFAGYVASVAGGQESRPLYGWNLCKWLDGVKLDNLLHVETLKEDLALEGVVVEQLPTENRSYRAQPYRAFYNAELLGLIAPWARADCERFGYEWPAE